MSAGSQGPSSALDAAQITELQDKIRDAIGDIPQQQADLAYGKTLFGLSPGNR